ncbi:MAG: geranylgeranylglyceryl/heptaprenylglyceryl phosphate synthase [Flavobacterium sp.]|jgi:phosphoglycerol geranylgeranyltransferase
MKLLERLINDKRQGKKNIALLLDPEKINILDIDYLTQKVLDSPISFILIGGSYIEKNSIDQLVLQIKLKIKLPIFIFPGHPSQISNNADAILFLSLISGRNPDFLIEHHVNSIPILEKTNLEIIPTSYLLIGSNNKSSVEKLSKTSPLDENNFQKIIDTALAGLYLGHQITYLEAGSGANVPISMSIIKAVSNKINNPIFVGGGIKNILQIQQNFDNGADVVVIGNSFENNMNFFNL